MELLNLTNPPSMVREKARKWGGQCEFPIVPEIVKEFHSDKGFLRSIQMLKASGVQGLSWLTHLFNITWKSETVPREWQTGMVVIFCKRESGTELNIVLRYYSLTQFYILSPAPGSREQKMIPLLSSASIKCLRQVKFIKKKKKINRLDHISLDKQANLSSGCHRSLQHFSNKKGQVLKQQPQTITLLLPFLSVGIFFFTKCCFVLYARCICTDTF